MHNPTHDHNRNHFGSMLGARKRRATNQHRLWINLAIKMKRSASFQGALKAFAKKNDRCSNQRTRLFLIYEDENEIPSKAKVGRGTKGIDANLDFLSQAPSEQPKMSFTKTQVEKILDLTASINKLRFKTSAEQTDWKETITKRWRSMCRVVSSAESKKRNQNEHGSFLGARLNQNRMPKQAQQP